MSEAPVDPRRQTDVIGPALCLLAWLVLLAALALGELRQGRLQIAHELALLRRDAHHLLDKPSLFEAESFDLMQALSQDAGRLAQRLADSAPILADEAGSKQLAQAAADLSRLAGQRKAFASLGQLTERLAVQSGDPAAGPRALPMLCGDDPTVTHMPRLRSLIDQRLAQGKAGESGPLVSSSAEAVSAQFQQALQVVEQFRGLRRQALAALDQPRVPAPAAALVHTTAAGGLLLALLAAVRWNQQRLRAARRPLQAAAARPHGVSLTSPPPMLDADLIPVLSLATAVPEPSAQALAVRRQQDEQWQDLRRSVLAAFDTSCLLERYASNLSDATRESDDPTQDEVLLHLGPLADRLLTARESALNLGLSLLPDTEAQPSPVAAMERLDQQLVAILDVLSRLEQLRSIDASRAANTADVPRHALVHLQSELQHLSRQLAALHDDVVDGGAALPVVAADR